jgi:hypothetical protein
MRFLILLLVSAFATYSYANMKAVTDKGDVVILQDDGTWIFEKPKDVEKSEIKTNKKKFKKDGNASFNLKSTKNNSEFWIDPKKWSFKKGEDGAAAEYTLQLTGEDLYAMVITEQIELPIENFGNIALLNARKAAPDTRILLQEYRQVNGSKILYVQMEGTLQGIIFVYFGYYTSNKNGSTQYVAYTAKNLVPKYESEIFTLLNGFSP